MSLTTLDMQEEVLVDFCSKGIILGLIIARRTLGLELIFPDIARIANWGLPNTLEYLVQ